jgi:anti-sigma regulatory factor (Ser/Thr protein kinase)
VQLTHRAIAVSDRSSIGETRRIATALAETMGFSEDRRSDIGIVVTEAATNVLLHAKAGEVMICPMLSGDQAWLDLLALDAGPGIADMSRALEDGYSTQGTAGQGLGAIQRLSDSSSIYSVPGRGTVTSSRFLLNPELPDPHYGAINLPLKGETTCGDAFVVIPGSGRTLYMMVDGLGHGPSAHEAAEEALEVTRKYANEPAPEILSLAHDALKKTRGAAMSVALVNHDRATLTYAGVGNISAALTKGTLSRSLVSQNGTLGAVLPRAVQEYTYPLEPDSMLVMFSDGLNSKSSLTGYAGIQNRPPALLAGLLYRDFTRGRDDATVLVARLEGARP